MSRAALVVRVKHSGGVAEVELPPVPAGAYVEAVEVLYDGHPLVALPFTLHGHALTFEQLQGHTHEAAE